MNERILFAVQNKIGLLNEAPTTYLQSQYLLNYKQNRESIQRKNAWKSEGFSAGFRGDLQAMQKVDFEEVVRNATINGIAFVNQGEKIAYSVTVQDFSGIFLKNPLDDAEDEGHVIHDNSVQFLNFDPHPSSDEIIISLQNSAYERHIAILNLTNSHYRVITEGDSFDENPVWGRANPKTIYYESAGIGRNSSGVFACLGPKAIQRLNLNSGELDEMAAWPQSDCICPKADSEDNLYFIRKPYHHGKSRVTLKEVLLIPVKIIKAIYRWIEFFTIRHTGEAFSSAGYNPVKMKTQDPKEIFYNGNIINAERTLKENTQKGEKYPGIAPRNWELIKRNRDGQFITVKRGVLDFDIGKDGSIVYSNGKYLVRLDRDGREQMIERVELAGRISVSVD